MKPIVGIIMRLDDSRSFLKNEVLNYVIQSGGIPIGIYQSNNITDEIITLCDGFIFQGGDEFTNYDLDLMKKLIDIKKCVLGICLGMQTMAVSIGGTLNEMHNLKHLSSAEYVHSINIDSNSKLYNILGNKTIMVNSRHKDNIKGTNMFVSAISEDGIIEAVELKNYPFFIGVQWHPESLNDINSKNLFDSFILACKGVCK